MKKCRQILFFLIVLIGVSAMPMRVDAEGTLVGSGSWGTNLTWDLTSDGTLTIRGVGQMKSDSWSGSASSSAYPWRKDHNEQIKNIVIENGVTSIANAAFMDSTVESVSIPGSVTKIEKMAFKNCTRLGHVTIPGSVATFDKDIFYGCTALSSATLEDGITTVGEGLFSGCTSLTSISLPQGLTAIGASAFSGCTSLPAVSIPRSVASIGSYAFLNCKSLPDISIPQSVVSIGNSAFCNCIQFETFYLPAGVTELEGVLFGSSSSDSALKSIVVDQNNPNYRSIDGILYDKSLSKIIECPMYVEMESLTIPASVCEIGSCAFYYNKTISSVSFASGSQLDKIMGYGFGFSSIKQITLPSELRTIGSYAFYKCDGLKSIRIPDKVTTVGYQALRDCAMLEEVYFGENVETLGEWCCSYCPLKRVELQGKIRSIGTMSFYGDSSSWNVQIYIRAMDAPEITDSMLAERRYGSMAIHVPLHAEGYNEGNWKPYKDNMRYDLDDLIDVFAPGNKVTEDDLYGPYYKYLTNDYYDKITNKLFGEMNTINAERSGLDNAQAVLISNLKQGASSSLINSTISLVTGKYYKQDELEETVALKYIQTLSNDDEIASYYIKKVKKGLKNYENVNNIIKAGFKNENEKELLAEALESDFFTKNEALDLIRSTEDNWEDIDKIFGVAGEVVNSAEIAATVIITSSVNKAMVNDLMLIIDSDTALYRGLKSIQDTQNNSKAVEIVKRLIEDHYFGAIASFMTKNGIGRLSSLIAGTGGIQVGLATTIAGLGYFVLGSVADIYEANSDEVVTSVIAVSNQCALQCSIADMRQRMMESGTGKYLRDEYTLAYKAYLVSLKEGVDDALAAAIEGDTKDNLKRDSKKYLKDLTYSKYIKACLKEANRELRYTVISGKAMVVGTGSAGSSSPSKAGSLRKAAGLTRDAADTGSESDGDDDYEFIVIPDTIGEYEVTRIGPEVFGDNNNVRAVVIPDSVEKIDDDAFANCPELTDIFFGSGVKTIGANAFAGCSSIEVLELPSSVETIGKGAFPDNEGLVIITDDVDAVQNSIQAGEYVNADSITVVEREPELSGIRISTYPEKLSYTMSEIAEPDAADISAGRYSPVDLFGLVLTAVYDDGSEETINSGFYASFEEKKIGENTVNIYYLDKSASYTVTVSADECPYEISYVDIYGNDLADKLSGIKTAGEELFIDVPEIDGYDPIDGPQTVIIAADNDYKVRYKTHKKPSVGDAVITLSGKKFTYTGKAIVPEVSVKYDDATLENGKDYTLSYHDNTKPGTAAVVILGCGEYEGIAIKSFTIEKEEASQEPFATTGSDAAAKKAALKKASNINKATVTATDIKKASKLGAKSVTLGAKVRKIKKNAFKGTKITTVTVKTKRLKASSVRGSLKGSKVKTIKVKVGSAKINKKYVKAYKKIFTKTNAGKKVTVK